MMTGQLCEILAARGVNGAPPADRRWYVVEYDGGGDVNIIRACPATLSLLPCDVTRHVLLSNVFEPQVERCARAPGEGTWSVFAAKVVEERDEALRRVAALEKAARKDASSTFRVEQVWESPNGLLYRVVDIRPREQYNTARISMRRGADGAGRLYVKRGESTFGWRLVTP